MACDCRGDGRASTIVDTVKDWCQGRMRGFGPSHGAFADLERLLAEHEREVRQARERLDAWRQGQSDNAT